MDETLFSHTDEEGDHIRVTARIGKCDSIYVRINDGSLVNLGAAEIRALRDALNKHLPKTCSAPFTAAEIREMAREEFERLFEREAARVMPLHRAPMAYIDAIPFVPKPDAETGWTPVNPEPRDVGYPEAAPGDVAYPRQLTGCTACGHGWGVHQSSTGCTSALGVRICPCTRIRPTGLET